MKRVRLTQRKAADDKTPYPGTVNQEGRTDPSSTEYENYEEVPGWETQDLNTEWKKDSRDEINFPVQKQATVAGVRQAARKAVRLAVMLLGDRCSEDVVEQQARDFMRLGPRGLDNALMRYSETEELYAESDEEKEAGELPEALKENMKKMKEGDLPGQKNDPDDKKEDKKKKSEDEEDEKDETEEASKKKKSEDEEEDKEETEEASKKKKSEDDDDDDSEEETEASKKKKSEDDDDDDSEDDSEEETEASKKKSEDDEEEKEESCDKKKKSEDDAEEEEEESEEASKKAELDIELAPAIDADFTAEDDRILTQLYAEEDREASDGEEKPEKIASKKKGVKSIGAQPRVATSSEAPKLSELWNDAPDISEFE